MSRRNSIEFKVWARHALFTDPLTRIGGEKCSYHIPTYEALKGIAKSIYWKPTFIWVIDEVRVMRPIRTQTKGTKPLNFGGVFPSKRDPSKKEEPSNTLAIYTFLSDVEYQVRAHFEQNVFRPELAEDWIEGKHHAIAKRMLERGGRQDIFLGTRDCQGYVEPCVYASEASHYDDAGELAYGLMFHGFDYPDETGENNLRARFWRPVMVNGCIQFVRPQDCPVSKLVRPMTPKKFGIDTLRDVTQEATDLGV
ncbi:MAG: type I-C CRISPR-associated protein Cas5 [Rhodoferax sp.]|jgi:CRISPR-associated protein Cas5d|uniref:type I-C CRISPR-associated protein Cas5c n=1 Tax=Rhodoferax sp. TaxID=50421 RepID=UPI001B61C426|nr:type I-C CRISPR-associated protein Cas5c [Rhodoferax sp.]MBP9147866.1 type I-C CRISPR-associated protein Cas5 [Rhodoferax sp.]MBP9736708.1 type I-C CRISPR-associated protein Cas5 [Rhodoferax sp.]